MTAHKQATLKFLLYLSLTHSIAVITCAALLLLLVRLVDGSSGDAIKIICYVHLQARRR